MTVSSKSFHQKLLIHILDKSKYARNPIEKGFTLIELLVVLVIIAILTAIGITQYRGVIDAAASTGAKLLVVADAKQCAGSCIDGDCPGGFTQTEVDNTNITYAPAQACSESATFTATGGGDQWKVTLVDGFPGLPTT